MIVADTSALISLTIAESLDHLLDEFTVHTTTIVVRELEETATYNDAAATAATSVLDRQDRYTIHQVEDDSPMTSRIDIGEGSCVVLANRLAAAFLLTDDLRALPELQQLCDATVAISPIVLKALVQRDVLSNADAKQRIDRLAATRDWLEAPIYRRARRLFETEE